MKPAPEYIPAVEKGIKAMNKGIVAGYPLMDIKATVYDGSYHEVDSSEGGIQNGGKYGIPIRGKTSTAYYYGANHEG